MRLTSIASFALSKKKVDSLNGYPLLEGRFTFIRIGRVAPHTCKWTIYMKKSFSANRHAEVENWLFVWNICL